MEEIKDLADLATEYYNALRTRDIPESLAIRLAGDWHQAMCQWMVMDTHNRFTASQMTRRIVKGSSHA